MKKNIFVVILIIIAVVIVAIPVMSFASRRIENSVVGNADMVQESKNAVADENAGRIDCIEVSQLTAVITPYNDDSDGVSHSSWELTVTLENGDILTKYYDYGNYYVRDPELYYADLNGDGNDEIVLIMPNATSNYVASNIHVLRVDKDILTEILTILDSPQEEYKDDYKDNYKDSLFIIPNIATDEELPPYTPEGYEAFCTGAVIVQTSEGTDLWVRHLMKDSVPYSVIRWSGDGWYVAEQGINLVPNINKDNKTSPMKFYDVVLPAPNAGGTVNYDSYYQKTEVYPAENEFNSYIDFNGERYLIKLCFERLNEHSNAEVIPKIRLSIFILDEDYNILYESVIKNSNEPETDEFVSGNAYYISLKRLEQTIPNLMFTCMTWHGGHGSYISIAYENENIIVYEELSGENQFPIEIMRICISNVQNDNRVQEDSDVLLNFTDENFEQKSTIISKDTITETYMEYDFENSKFVIFKNSEDDENAHSGVIINETLYDFGEVSTLFQVEQCTITTTDIYGFTLVKITGVLGAAYAPTEYYCIDSSENEKYPRLVLRIENYNNKEVDLDSDGVKEVFECSMFTSLLHRYDVNSRKFYVADLIADTGTTQFVMDDNKLFTAYIEHGEVYGVYKYSDGRLSKTTSPQSDTSEISSFPDGRKLTTEQKQNIASFLECFGGIELDYITLLLHGLFSGDIALAGEVDIDYNEGILFQYCAYSLFDLDGNGFPEFFLKTGVDEASYWITVYTITGGKLVECGSFSGSHTALYVGGSGGFLCYEGHMGLYDITISELEGTALITHEIKSGELDSGEEYPGLDELGYGDYDKYVEYTGIGTLFVNTPLG